MNFSTNVSPQWIEEQYRLWRQARKQLPAEWRAFFSGFELAQAADGSAAPELARKQSAVDSLIYRYRDIGHLLACTDPLSPCPLSHPLLALAAFGLDEADLDTVFHTGALSSAERHPARDRRHAAGDLLPLHRRRIHAHPGSGRAPVADRADGSRRNRPGIYAAEKSCAFCANCRRPPCSSSFCTAASSARSASPSKGAKCSFPLLDDAGTGACRRRGARPGPRHAPPRPAQRAGQHLRQAAGEHLCRVRGQPGIRLCRRGGRQVPKGFSS